MYRTLLCHVNKCASQLQRLHTYMVCSEQQYMYFRMTHTRTFYSQRSHRPTRGSKTRDKRRRCQVFNTPLLTASYFFLVQINEPRKGKIQYFSEDGYASDMHEWHSKNTASVCVCIRFQRIFLLLLFVHRVSSVLNRDIKQFGKRCMFDGLEETCWNSDQVDGVTFPTANTILTYIPPTST